MQNFFSSYGLIILGIVLLFGATVTVKNGYAPLLKFPEAGIRTEAHAGEEPVMKQLPVSRPTIPLAVNKNEFPGKLTALAALAVDDTTDTVLYSNNSAEARPLASITKLMSTLVFMDLPMDWSTSTVVKAEDLDSDNQISPGEEYTLDDLLHVALIASSNSAINVLVRSTGMTREGFVMLMNKKAAELKLASAHFVEPTGLDAGNVASADDTARILQEVLRFKKVLEIMHIGEYHSHPLNKEKKKVVWTTNRLLTNWVQNDFDVKDIAGKTGYIDDSRYNFTVRLTDKDGHAVRVVILGAATSDARFSEARDLAEWAFAHYRWPDQEGYDKLVE